MSAKSSKPRASSTEGKCCNTAQVAGGLSVPWGRKEFQMGGQGPPGGILEQEGKRPEGQAFIKELTAPNPVLGLGRGRRLVGARLPSRTT